MSASATLDTMMRAATDSGSVAGLVAMAARADGSYASQIGLSAWHHMPGSSTVTASRCAVSAAAIVGPIMHTHMLIEWTARARKTHTRARAP